MPGSVSGAALWPCSATWRKLPLGSTSTMQASEGRLAVGLTGLNKPRTRSRGVARAVWPLGVGMGRVGGLGVGDCEVGEGAAWESPVVGVVVGYGLAASGLAWVWG